MQKDAQWAMLGPGRAVRPKGKAHYEIRDAPSRRSTSRNQNGAKRLMRWLAVAATRGPPPSQAHSGSGRPWTGS
jgi:hypothetical protein